ncbi:MAG: hypothetical protein IPL62_19165 [Caulobacteraceae bacterium]|nr:hypothetical protein [Caulobacteraceae bacterium]
MQALAHAGYDVGRLKADCSWLMAQESAGRWKLEHQGDYSSPATAYAILALKACGTYVTTPLGPVERISIGRPIGDR